MRRDCARSEPAIWDPGIDACEFPGARGNAFGGCVSRETQSAARLPMGVLVVLCTRERCSQVVVARHRTSTRCGRRLCGPVGVSRHGPRSEGLTLVSRGTTRTRLAAHCSRSAVEEGVRLPRVCGCRGCAVAQGCQGKQVPGTSYLGLAAPRDRNAIDALDTGHLVTSRDFRGGPCDTGGWIGPGRGYQGRVEGARQR